MAEKVTVADIFKGVKEFVQEMAPGLTAEKILSDIGQEVKQQAAHGSHEIAAMLFSGSGSGFVMYPRAGAENHDHGQLEAPETPEVSNEQDRGR